MVSTDMISRKTWKKVLNQMSSDARFDNPPTGHAVRLMGTCDLLLRLVELDDPEVAAIFDQEMAASLERTDGDADRSN